MITLAIKHGLAQAHRTFDTAPTVSQIKQDRDLRMELGYGDNVKVLVGGVEQADFTFLQGPSCTIETAANQKAG